MKLSFAFKVPLWKRFQILFLGGFHFVIEYRGQHNITNVICTPMRVELSSVTITKENKNDN